MDDPFFGPPFLEEDVWQDGAVRYRDVHGGFEGTDTRFAFYFLDPDHNCADRFVQPVGVRHVLVNGVPIRVDGMQDLAVRSGKLVKSVPRTS